MVNTKFICKKTTLKIVEAFAALGGNMDKTGTVKRETIENLIQNEFELTFDIEHLLEKFGANSEELNFQSFCLLFSGNFENQKEKMRGSLELVIHPRK